MVVAAMDDVVAQLGELEQSVEHLEDRRAAYRLRSANVQEFDSASHDRLAVGGHVSDVCEVLVTDLRLRPPVEILKVFGQALILADSDCGRHTQHVR